MNNVENVKDIIVTSGELAQILGIPRQSLVELKKAGLITPIEEEVRGKAIHYNLCDAVSHVYRDTANRAGGRTGKKAATADIDTKIKEKKYEILTNQATMSDLQVNEVKGKYHRSEDVVELLTAYNEVVRGSLLALPSSVALDLTNISNAERIAKILKSRVLEILKELNEYQYDKKRFKAKALARNKLEADDQ